MNTRRAIRIDNWFSLPYRILLALASFNSKEKGGEQEILIIKFFGIGSLIRILNFIENSEIQKERITFLTLASNAQVLKSKGYAVMSVDDSSMLSMLHTAIRNMLRVWAKNDTVIYDLERSSNLAGLFREIAGWGKFKSYGVYQKVSDRKSGRNAVDLRRKNAWDALEEVFGVQVDFRAHEPGDGDNSILVNINASDYLPERRMSEGQWVKLIKELYPYFNHCNWVFTGTKAEKEQVDSLCGRLHAKGIECDNLAGELNFEQWEAHIRKANLVLTVDSSAAHLAVYHQRPSVVIWGPTSPNMVGYARHSLVLNISQSLGCQPCFVNPKSKVARECSNKIDCLGRLDMDMVATDVVRFYERTNAIILES